MDDMFKLIKPSFEEEEKLQKVTDSVIGKIKIPHTKVILGGSGAKKTWLKGNHDIDIYVIFPKKAYAGKDISAILYEHLRTVFPKVSVLHGSRDYFQKIEKGYTVEIIPILEIKKAEENENITDVSPLHVKFVRSYPELSDDIRMAKAFFKAQGVYGAESYIRGFSGYVAELLTISSGGFQKLMKNILKWKDRVVIDVAHYYKNEKEVLAALNEAKVHSPLIIVDPVQKDRNAAAGLDQEKFELLKGAARNYLKKPSFEFFVLKEFSLDALQKRYHHLVAVKAVPLRGKHDVVGAKLLKVHEFLKRELGAFKVLDSGWNWNHEAVFWFALKEKKLPAKTKHYGPPVHLTRQAENFKKVWKHARIEKKRVYAFAENKIRDPKKFLKKLMKDEYVTSRVKKSSLI